MKEQNSIPSKRFSRAAALTSAGARIGANYAKHSAIKTFTGRSDQDALHRANASTTYNAFSKLKGGPLKVAQMLSIDKNLLPDAYAEAFQQAYYSAPPLSYPLVARTFKRELGKAPTDIFDEFSRSAVAGASIGQVHKARIGDKWYAVKVQYPGVADSLKSDIELVKPFATRLLNLDAAALEPYFREVEERLVEETNYDLELQRSIELTQNTRGHANIQFPDYHPELSSKRILVSDWVDGIPLDKWIDTDPDQDTRDAIGQALWDFTHHQVHKLRHFHADLHPGNFIVNEGRLWALDFGCVKKLDLDFYIRFIALLDSARVSDPIDFARILEDLDLLRPGDTPEMRDKLAKVYHDSIQILSEPYKTKIFDFGANDYMQSIFEFSVQTRQDKELERITSSRGDANAVYINRASFGLYALESRLRARIRATLPEIPRPAEPSLA